MSEEIVIRQTTPPGITLPFSILLLIINLVATLYMVGLIWMVQIVHYPLFNGVGEGSFIAYQKRHQFLITLIVGPPMLIEAFSSLLLVWNPPTGVNNWMILAGVGLLLVIWISTAAIQVPCHNKLLRGFDQATHHRLVRSNWIRTAAWTARGGFVVWMLVHVLSASTGV
ncbi:hypothetical protein [Novipirellula artificiosorum]|uniref:DUF1772 domain-containing protein n=1 Tax=Novipirellula artificiosorum TaxID=2528016 RepID=A0A5C6D3J6_9BACT|nr:hypothetical protein [Novipirellula artificiosorum]TWU31328.1 hypothetical protein Poly41_61970 [Novipirellula artificiosorum]